MFAIFVYSAGFFPSSRNFLFFRVDKISGLGCEWLLLGNFNLTHFHRYSLSKRHRYNVEKRHWKNLRKKKWDAIHWSKLNQNLINFVSDGIEMKLRPDGLNLPYNDTWMRNVSSGIISDGIRSSICHLIMCVAFASDRDLGVSNREKWKSFFSPEIAKRRKKYNFSQSLCKHH